MTEIENYLKALLKQILDSYQIIASLNDEAGDLEIIQKEVIKINGFFRVLNNKLKIIDNNSDDFTFLSSAVINYLKNYDFDREIETMSKLYSEDPNRLKNIRHTILQSLEDQMLMKKVESIMDKL